MPSATFLRPGQRYAKPECSPWRADQQVVLARVERCPDGVERVTYACPGGAWVTGPATRLEAAIAAGEVVPIAPIGELPRC
jgi:hypothetical protein